MMIHKTFFDRKKLQKKNKLTIYKILKCALITISVFVTPHNHLTSNCICCKASK